MNEFKRAAFCIDALPDQSFSGFSNGYTWNGWACPYFEKQTAEAVLRASEANGYSWEYNADTDAFLVRSKEDSPEYEPEEFSGQDIESDGEKILVYAIGAFSWTWETC